MNLKNQYESCQDSFSKIKIKPEDISNEADTRLKLIDVILFECLGWDKNNANTEVIDGDERVDYILSGDYGQLIVEAKKTALAFSLPAGVVDGIIKIETITAGNKLLGEAIKQAQGYAVSRGIEYACVTNGHQFVGFLAFHPGVAPLKGRALVFSSISGISAQFRNFWDAFSRFAVDEQLYKRKLLLKTYSPPPPKPIHKIYGKDEFLQRNSFQSDAKTLSEVIFEDILQDEAIEKEFLGACYCMPGAIESSLLLNRDIIRSRYEYVRSKSNVSITPAKGKKGLSEDLLNKAMKSRPIVLIGDVGAGKSTFIKHLMLIDSSEEISKSLTFYVNLGESAILSESIHDSILDSIESQLLEKYKIDPRADSTIKGAHQQEYQRFLKSPSARLKGVDEVAFIKAEIDFLCSLVKERGSHLRAVLAHLYKSAGRDSLIFIDNCDQRSECDQDQAFLASYEIAKSWPSLVYITLRPETFYNSQRRGGALSGYNSKVFTIPPPRITDAIVKRLDFAMSIASGESRIDYYKDFYIRLSKIWQLLQVTKISFENSGELRELLENISNGNTREALNLVITFLNSSHTDTDKIVKLHMDGHYQIPKHEFLKAIIFGDYKYYHPSASIIGNVFDIESNDPREHFAMPTLLAFLSNYSGPERDSFGFISMHAINLHLSSMRFSPEQSDATMKRALKHKLIYMHASDSNEPLRARATSTGAYHHSKLCSQFVYIDAISIDTPITNGGLSAQIAACTTGPQRIARARAFSEYLNSCWVIADMPASNYFPWPTYYDELIVDIDRVEASMERSNSNGNRQMHRR